MSLEGLGNEVSQSVENDEKKKIDNTLGELRTSLQRLKRKIDKGQPDGRPRGDGDSGGMGRMSNEATSLNENIVSLETDENDTICVSVRLSDDSDGNDGGIEEHRGLKDSSDGSQCGSDSGMGDSLMNTLASECTDGLTKTPTTSPEHHIAHMEPVMIAQGDEHGDIVFQNEPSRKNDQEKVVVIQVFRPTLSHPAEGATMNSKESLDIEQIDHVEPSDVLNRKTIEIYSNHCPPVIQRTEDDLNMTSDNHHSEFKPSDIDSPGKTSFTPVVPPSDKMNVELHRQGNMPGAITRDHDVDEELILRQLLVQNVDVDDSGKLEKVQEIMDEGNIEYSLVPGIQPPPMTTIDDFMTEPEVLLQRLVDIEVLMKPNESGNGNLKSALLKHVVS